MKRYKRKKQRTIKMSETIYPSVPPRLQLYLRGVVVQINEATSTPSLCRARVITEFTTFVGQLRQASPGALVDSLAASVHAEVDLLECFDVGRIEGEKCSKVETGWPQPLGALVVITTFRGRKIVTILTIAVIRAIIFICGATFR